MQHLRRKRSLTLVIAGLFLAVASPSFARPKIPVLRQLTSLSTGSIQSLRLQGQRGESLVFLSDGDVLGPGSASGNLELYEIDVENGAVRKAFPSGGADILQPTRATDPDDLERWPSYVAFSSSGDFDPSVGNADGNQEIFLWVPSSGAIHQITDTAAPVVNAEPFASDTGSCLAFTSNGDLDPEGIDDAELFDPNFNNADGSREIFVYALREAEQFPQQGQFIQVSNGPAGTSSDGPVVGGYTEPRQCQSVGYRADHDQFGGARSGRHLYIYSTGSGKLEDLTSRHGLPDGPPDGEYSKPWITGASNFARGPFLVFTTDLDLTRNGSASTSVYRYRIFHPALNQVIDLGDGETASSPVIADGGGHVAFLSDGELLAKAKRPFTPPFNTDGNDEVFLLRGRRRLRQITRSADCRNEQTSMRSDATRVAFVSDCGLLGQSLGQPQIYIHQLVFRGDPLLAPGACTSAENCCLGPPNCAGPVEGKARRPRRRGCLTTASGC